MVAPIGLGTVKLGRNAGVKYPRAFSLPSDAEVLDLLEGALARGVTLFDTAPAYGTSERRLAPFVRRHRERVVLATKAGERFCDGTSVHDFSPEGIERSLVASLDALGTDRVDLLLLHSDGRDLAILDAPGVVDRLFALRSRGLVRAVGISAKTAEGIDRAAELGLDCAMATYSRADPSRGAALARAHALGVGVLAIKALDSGHVATADDPARRASAARDAIAFAAGAPFVDAVVLGTLSLAHLDEAIAALVS